MKLRILFLTACIVSAVFCTVLPLKADVPIIAGPAPFAAMTTYSLAPGDVLQISVYEHPELSITIRIDGHGEINVPLCGRILSAGKTSGEIENLLATKLKQASIERPQVFVFVSEYTPRRVYLFGEVMSPQALDIPLGNSLSALQAISAVGGFTPRADYDNVFVMRKGSNGKQTRFMIDVRAIMSARSQKSDFPLLPNDTVVARSREKFYVLGQVTHAGAFDLDKDHPVTVARAIAMAGGFARLAAEDAILVIQGSKITPVDLRKALTRKGNLSHDILVEAGDIVYVQESRW